MNALRGGCFIFGIAHVASAFGRGGRWGFCLSWVFSVASWLKAKVLNLSWLLSGHRACRAVVDGEGGQ